MISGSSVLRKYMPGIISGPLVIRMYILESLNMCLSYGCLGMCFYIPWQNFANMVSPGKMTTTARTASKFCARTRSECPDIFFLDLISWWISGSIEPGPECQPKWHGSAPLWVTGEPTPASEPEAPYQLPRQNQSPPYALKKLQGGFINP